MGTAWLGGHVKTSEKGLTTEAFAQILAKRLKQAGITERTTLFDFRRTLAGDLLEDGNDIAKVQKILGHDSPKATSDLDRRPDETYQRALQDRSHYSR